MAKSDPLVAGPVPPPTLERNLIRRQPKQRDLDIGKAKASLNAGATV